MTSLITLDNCYVTLLSLAEGFRTSSPPDIRRTVQCLQAVLNLPVDHYILAKTHLQLGDLIMRHTSNIDIACRHLEDAWKLASNIGGADDIRLEALSMLASTYERSSQPHLCKEILSRGLDSSSNIVWWHSKFLFHLAHINATERNHATAANLLSAGADFAQMSGATYTQILFLLSKGMVLMIDQRLKEALPVLSLAQQLLEAWQGNSVQKESLTVFFLILQVCFHLNAGKAKSAKTSLKILQQVIQNSTNYESSVVEIYAPNGDGGFHWMPKEHICILVYLVNVLHSMQAGYMDRAQKYTEKALMQIDKLRTIDDHPLLNTFQLILFEHISMCRLVMGNRTTAMKEIVQAIVSCNRDYRLRERHIPIIRSLLGLYAMSMSIEATAEFHLTAVLRSVAASPELKILASLNLSIVYLRMGRHAELNDLLSKFNPDTVQSGSLSVKAACSYILGLNAFFQNRFNDAKRYLRNTLQLANTEELNRLTSCSLVLLGHIFFALGNSRESMNMVTPAMELATKIPDIHVQLWSTALLKELYRLCGNNIQAQQQAQQADQLHTKYSQVIMNDYYLATQSQEHNFYLNWAEEG